MTEKDSESSNQESPDVPDHTKEPATPEDLGAEADNFAQSYGTAIAILLPLGITLGLLMDNLSIGLALGICLAPAFAMALAKPENGFRPPWWDAKEKPSEGTEDKPL